MNATRWKDFSRLRVATATVLAMALPVLAQAAATPRDRCEAGKLKVSNGYSACRLKADAIALQKETPADYSKCDAKFSLKFPIPETKAGPMVCPTEGDAVAIKALVDDCNADLTTALAGGGLPPVCGNAIVETGEDCDVGDLAAETCETQGFAGGALGCAPGCTFDTGECYDPRFDASGDTIIDRRTGLEWEKKDASNGVMDFANPHDVDNVYAWSFSGAAPDGAAFTDFLAKLNGVTGGICHEDHCDWRLPTLAELQTIVIPSPSCGVAPCVQDAGFLPNVSNYYTTISTLEGGSNFVHSVYFFNGTSFAFSKTFGLYARAVRTGS